MYRYPGKEKSVSWGAKLSQTTDVSINDHCNLSNQSKTGTLKYSRMSNSSISMPGNHCIYRSTVTQKVIPAAYGVIFLGGILLNGVAAWIFLHVPNKKSFVVYLKNIVAADLLMSLTFPFKILSDSEIGPWQLNVFVCRFSAVIFYLNMYIGIAFFGLIGFDRYYKTVKPLLTSFVHTVNYSKIISIIIWAFLIFLSLPNSILTNKTATADNSKKCVQLKSELGLQWHEASNYICLGIFWTVFLLLIIFYSGISRKMYSSYRKFRRNSTITKEKINRNIFSIMFVFVVCFVPYHLCRIPYTLSQTGYHQFTCQTKKHLYYAKEFTLLLSAANVCLDPIIYLFLCKPFREKLHQKLYFKTTSGETENSRSRRSNTS